MGGDFNRALELRPLNVGEIFDRAITLYIRNIVPCSVIAAFLVVPLSILSYFAFFDQASVWQQVLDQMQHPAKTAAPPQAVVAAMFANFAVAAIALLGQGFVYAALAALVGRIYRGETVDWRPAIGSALRRSPGILCTIALMILAFGSASAGAGLVLGILFVIDALLITYAMPLGMAMLLVTAAVAIAAGAALMLCFLAFALALDAIGVEDEGVFGAIGKGFGRIFNRREVRRSIVICFAFVVMQGGIAIFAGGIQMMLAVTGETIVETIVTGAMSLISTAFIGVLVTVYYFDVRTRQEGLDVQAEIDALAVTA